MPKKDIDYSNTIIYKITCKDSKVTDVYVGHTTNFVQRKYIHKQSCTNIASPNYDCKLYKVIRSNGGWSNWKIEIINFFNCYDHYEARQKELEYFISLNATLNSIEPMPKPKSISMFKTKKTNNSAADGINSTLFKFICEACNYKCCKKSEWIRHTLTIKHINTTNYNQKSPEIATKEYTCSCGKIYNHRSSLFNHKKKCNITITPKSIYNKNIGPESDSLSLLVIELIKSNQELQKQMLEVCKNSNSTINNNNSHNKTFNMQFFLNEQCKDAMNIMDFVDTFKLEFSDLENVGEIGYVEGMSNIIIQKLNEMDVYKRPIHCSDAKRETMFVKDKNVWEKENGTHDRLRLAIRHIAKKNSDMLNKWSEAHPGSCESDNYLHDIYMEMVMQAMGGRGNREENENKIMRKIARTCLIDKDL